MHSTIYSRRAKREGLLSALNQNPLGDSQQERRPTAAAANPALTAFNPVICLAQALPHQLLLPSESTFSAQPGTYRLASWDR